MDEFPDLEFIEGFTGDGLERRVDDDVIPEDVTFGEWGDLTQNQQEPRLTYTEKDLFTAAKEEINRVKKQMEDKFSMNKEAN